MGAGDETEAPESCRAIVAEVPFVDVLTTMLDDSLPLTVGEVGGVGQPAPAPRPIAR